MLLFPYNFHYCQNAGQLPDVLSRIFSEAFGLRQAIGGGIGAAIMNGAKRGLFSNEAGSGSAPVRLPLRISTILPGGAFRLSGIHRYICNLHLYADDYALSASGINRGLAGMDLLQAAMAYYFGEFGVVFIALILFLFSFSTFLGILFYARSNVAYLFGDNWLSQTLYKVLTLVMLFIGGIAAYQFVWDLGDVGVGLMTIFNMIALFPLAPKALQALTDYEHSHKR